jgi:hypothetical protein
MQIGSLHFSTRPGSSISNRFEANEYAGLEITLGYAVT